MKDITVFLKKKKKKSDKTFVSDTKIYQTMKSWLSIEKNLQNENHLANIVGNYFCSENFFFQTSIGDFSQGSMSLVRYAGKYKKLFLIENSCFLGFFGN